MKRDKRALINSIKNKFTSRNMAVELTNACNLRCPLCSTGSGFSSIPKGMMDYGSYKKLINEVSPFIDTVGFVGSGEPFLHPNLMDFISYAATKRKNTFCCTNGNLMKNSDALIKSGLDTLYVDIDGLTQEQHEMYRKGSNLEVVLNNIKNLVRAKKRLLSRHPKIYMDVLISRYNENNFSSFIQLAKEITIDGVRFRSMIDDLFHTTDWFPTLDKFRHRERTENYICEFQNRLFGILSWNGDIQLCCMTPHHKEPLIKSNAFQEKDICTWMDSDKFYNISKNAGNYEFCSTCFMKKYTTYSEEIVLDGQADHILPVLRRYKRCLVESCLFFFRKIIQFR